MTKRTCVKRNTHSTETISKQKDNEKIFAKVLTKVTDCDARCNVIQQAWTKDETAQLMNLIFKKLKEVGSFSYARIQRLNWNQIKVDGKSTLECKNQFNELKSCRGMRALDMIKSYVDIGESDNKNSKQSKTILRGKNFSKKTLESKKRSQKFLQITRTIIITPLMLYQEYNEKNGGELNKNKLKKKFHALADNEKLEWIRKAVNANKDSKNINKILNDNELRIWRGEPKRPLQMYNLFIKMKCDEGMTRKTALNAYGQLNKDEKEVYREISRQAEIQYRIDLENFVNSLPAVEKGQYLTKLRALKRKEKEKAISTSVSSNHNVENPNNISENNRSNGVDPSDLVICSELSSSNIKIEPRYTTDLGYEKTPDDSSRTTVPEPNVNTITNNQSSHGNQNTLGAQSVKLEPNESSGDHGEFSRKPKRVGSECDAPLLK